MLQVNGLLVPLSLITLKNNCRGLTFAILLVSYLRTLLRIWQYYKRNFDIKQYKILFSKDQFFPCRWNKRRPIFQNF